MRIKYKIMLAIITVGIGICLMTYQSYALWVANFTGGENIVNVGCFSIEFREDTNPISLNNTYPVSDAKGLTTTPYTFTITNTCTVDASYSVTLNTINTNTMTKNMIKYAIQKSTSPKPTSGINLGTNTNYNTAIEELNVTNLDESIIIETGTLKGKSSNEANDGESITYNLYLWMDEQTGNEGMNTTFEGSINIISSASKIRDIADEIIASVDTTGKCPTVNEDGTVVVNSKEATYGYVCSAPDDYGTSYYFRGTVENNWVKFANSYWRIIRVNGDKSIRMIYAGDATVIDTLPNKEEVLKNGYNDGDTDYTQIGTSAFNSSRDDNAYVGYMYGTRRASTYDETHANTNDSTIKIKVDEWYETYLKDTEYESYLSDTLFCSDRSFHETDNSGTGVGTSETNYRPSSRNTTLKCSKKNDRFTVDDEEIGNGDLTYPISLITNDEVYLAGGKGGVNSSYYLYTGNRYWALSPGLFNGSRAAVSGVADVGVTGIFVVDGSYGVRPVINLKAGSLTKGSGTALDPYQV